MFKMASQAATCMPSSKLRCNKGQRSVQVFPIFLPREACCSSQVGKTYVALVKVEITILEMDGAIERYKSVFQKALSRLTRKTMLQTDIPISRRPDNIHSLYSVANVNSLLAHERILVTP